MKLSPTAMVIAPGGIWPEKAAARRATQPAWMHEQAARDQKRNDWLLT